MNRILQNILRFQCVIMFATLFGNDFFPPNNAELNYIQVQFYWPQINDVDYYNLYIDNGQELYEISLVGNVLILDEFIDWDKQYTWQVCGFTDDVNPYYCYDSKSFAINNLPINFPTNLSILSNNQNGYQPGINILDFESLGFSLALNSNGTPIWFANKNNFSQSKILVTQMLETGNFIGYSTGSGYEFTIDSEIIFQTSSEYQVHHEIRKTVNDTYFFIDAEIEFNECPIDDCEAQFGNLISWQGDQFIEVNNSGQVLWEWNTFDYLEIDEVNLDWFYTYSTTGEFDWTHSNSVYYDNQNETVYVSLRNLSRITAIDYDSKEIKWNLGNSDFMNEIFFDNELGFSHQHSVQKISNGNVLFFDNGRGNTPELSRCLEVSVDEEPIISWEYVLPDSMKTLSRGECDRLANGNTLITAGRTGNVIEVNNEGQIIWHLSGKDNNNNDITMYRTQRVFNLHPTAFSIQIENLEGNYGSYTHILNSSINLSIDNISWASNEFSILFLDELNNVILSNTESISEFSNNSIIIDFEQNQIVENNKYTIKVYPNNNPNNSKQIEFSFFNLLGDLNNDSIINILDIIYIVDIIMEDEQFNSLADINNDNNIDILDILQLVNIIIDR